jgi:hypothetical protein
MVNYQLIPSNTALLYSGWIYVLLLKTGRHVSTYCHLQAYINTKIILITLSVQVTIVCASIYFQTIVTCTDKVISIILVFI